MKYVPARPLTPDTIDRPRAAKIIATEEEVGILFELFAKGDYAGATAFIGPEIVKQLEARHLTIATPTEPSNISAQLYGCPVIVDRRHGERRRRERRE